MMVKTEEIAAGVVAELPIVDTLELKNAKLVVEESLELIVVELAAASTLELGAGSIESELGLQVGWRGRLLRVLFLYEEVATVRSVYCGRSCCDSNIEVARHINTVIESNETAAIGGD